MKFKSEVLTAAAGSIGGATYQRGKGGLQRQAKPRPTNTSTPAQKAARAAFQQIAIAFRENLTQSQRDSWSNYAELSPVSGRFGDPLVLTGSQMFLRCNSVRSQAGLALIGQAPAQPGLEPLTPPNGVVFAGDIFVQIQFTNTDPWANEVGGGLIIQTSRFLAAARNFSRGRLRFFRVILGAVAPPASPQFFLNNAFGQPVNTTVAGMKLSLRYVAFSADGRISSQQTQLVTLA